MTNRPKRRGLASVAVLIALLIVGIICAALLKVGLARRDQVKMAERASQAGWLADSGLDRAASRLAQEAGYAGETWEVPAEDLGGRGAGSVAIGVEPVEGRPEKRKVRVVADYPSGSPSRARRTKVSIVDVPHPPR